MQQLGGTLLGTLAATIVASGRGDAGMARELLHTGDVGAGIEQLADERAAQVMRREVVDAGALTEELQDAA